MHSWTFTLFHFIPKATSCLHIIQNEDTLFFILKWWAVLSPRENGLVRSSRNFSDGMNLTYAKRRVAAYVLTWWLQVSSDFIGMLKSWMFLVSSKSLSCCLNKAFSDLRDLSLAQIFKIPWGALTAVSSSDASWKCWPTCPCEHCMVAVTTLMPLGGSMKPSCPVCPVDETTDPLALFCWAIAQWAHLKWLTHCCLVSEFSK